ncbi:MAG: hypothetical protein QOG68_911 [Solirubrobacteraceae bacterium]|nr:hypothetical protein [Solirubrobacteraceae bacterium]
MRRSLPVSLLACAVLAGCGTPGADLLVAQRSGSIAGAALRLRVIDDGQAVCNGRSHELGSKDLIEAREVVRELGDPAKRDLSLPPGTPTVLRFRIRTEAGTVAFSDTSPGQPQIFYRAAELIRTIAKGACGLPR